MGLGEHRGAGIYAGDAGIGEATPTFNQAATVAFAEEQDVLRGGNVIKESRATALEFFSGENDLHPAIMRRQQIETHVAMGVRSHFARCHQSPASKPPQA